MYVGRPLPDNANWITYIILAQGILEINCFRYFIVAFLPADKFSTVFIFICSRVKCTINHLVGSFTSWFPQSVASLLLIISLFYIDLYRTELLIPIREPDLISWAWGPLLTEVYLNNFIYLNYGINYGETKFINILLNFHSLGMKSNERK